MFSFACAFCLTKGNNIMQSEKDLGASEQQSATLTGETQHEPSIKLTKVRFVLVLVGLVLAIFLVCLANLVA